MPNYADFRSEDISPKNAPKTIVSGDFDGFFKEKFFGVIFFFVHDFLIIPSDLKSA